MEGPSEQRESSDRSAFETLVMEHGTGWVLSMVAGKGDTIDGNGAGGSALLGIVVGGASMAMIDSEGVHPLIDPEHQWLFTFAASKDALLEMRDLLDETIASFDGGQDGE
jgi:hypothetical protein